MRSAILLPAKLRNRARSWSKTRNQAGPYLFEFLAVVIETEEARGSPRKEEKSKVCFARVQIRRIACTRGGIMRTAVRDISQHGNWGPRGREGSKRRTRSQAERLVKQVLQVPRVGTMIEPRSGLEQLAGGKLAH